VKLNIQMFEELFGMKKNALQNMGLDGLNIVLKFGIG